MMVTLAVIILGATLADKSEGQLGPRRDGAAIDDPGLYALLRGDIIRSDSLQQPGVTSQETEYPARSAALLALTGEIAFQTDRAASLDIYVRDADGHSPAVSLVSSAGNDFTPAWSPAGTHMVFASDRDGDSDIYLRTTSGEEYNLTQNTFEDGHPAWSPAGDRIIFTSDRGGSYFQIYTMRTDGTDVQQVGVVPGNNAMFPRYSPDGSHIAFMRASITDLLCAWNWDVWVMDADGGNQQRVTTLLGADVYPHWTPDGSRIVYASCRNFSDFNLYAVDVSAGLESQITNWASSNEWDLVFSPDAEHIAFSADDEGDAEIYVGSAAGGMVSNFTQNSANDLSASWSQADEKPKPQIIEVYPADGEFRVAHYPPPLIYAVFDMEMDTSSFTPDNMRVYEDGQGWVSGEVSVLSDTKIAFEPGDSLSPETLYTIYLDDDIRAMNGEALEAYQWSFTTALFDLTVTHLEVTQGIQDWDNSVPLLADKPTIVRVYVDCGEGCRSTPDVTAVLRGYREDKLIDSLSPENESITTHRWIEEYKRSDIAATLNFRLPKRGWLIGDVDIIVEVNPNHSIKESDYSNNTSELALSFNYVPPLRIGYVSLYYDGDGPDEERIARAQGFLQTVYPQSRTDYFPLSLCLQVVTKDSDEILRRLKLIYAFYEEEGWPAPFGRFDQLFGWVSDSTWGKFGGKSDPPWFNNGGGRVAFGTDTPENKLYQVIMAHEIGHNLGQQHPNCKFPDYAIRDVGFDFGFYAPDTLVSEDTDDFMIYSKCDPDVYDNRWISANTFKELYGVLTNTAQAANLQTWHSVETIQADHPVLLVSGYVYTDATAELDVAYQLTTNQVVSQSAGTDYCLSLEGSGTLSLSHTCFDLSFVDPEWGITQSAASFVQVLPYDSTAVRLVLKRGDDELAARVVSAHPPTVTLQTPNGSALISGTVDVTWTASDADGDSLSYVVSYSADEGQSWHHLGIGITETHLLINTDTVPGSEQALFRVMASDGINTVSDISDVFSVSPHGPQAVISNPDDGTRVMPDQVLLLQGKGYDMEDGILSDDLLSWTSDLDGVLGNGNWLVVSGLEIGAHIITLTVTDSEGNADTATVNVFVGSELYLPLILCDH
jgi:hypothetical protein